MQRKLDLIVCWVGPVLLLFLFLISMAIPEPSGALPPPPPPKERPVRVEIIKDEPLPRPNPKPKPEPKPKPKPKPKLKPKPKPKPKPEPEPPKLKPPVDTPKPAPVDAAGESESGVLPPLHANYRTKVGFRRYSEAMQRAGADFFVTGAKPGTLLQIDLAGNDLVEVSIARLATRGYSPRTRVIDEPMLKPLLAKARESYGVPNPQVLMLVPARMERRLATALNAGLKPKSISLADVTSIKGEYFLRNGRLGLTISAIHTAKGRVPMDLVLFSRND